MKTKLHSFFIMLALLAGVHHAAAQGTTAFTYQGQLQDGGTNANGTYTMIFALYDSASGGDLIGSAITNSTTLANGLFSLNLDFGSVAFNGSARWLAITITNGGATQTLAPRVQVLPSPYALFATTAGTVANGAITSVQLAANAVTAPNIASGQVVKSVNGLADFVALAAGANITLTTNGQTLTIASTNGGSGGAGTNFIPNMQLFSTNGTFIVPAGVTRILVEMWGGGGGGGGNNTDDSMGFVNSYLQGGGGGGGSSYSKAILTVTPGSSYPVTVGQAGSGGIANALGGTGGNGGSSSVGNLISAAGGNGGGNGNDSSGDAAHSGYGGNGGSNNGNINYLTISGGNGGSSSSDNPGGAAAAGGNGGQENGGNGGSPGGGGGGVYGSATALSGGNGASGMVIIYY
jgi:hypothetical protein